MRPILCGVLHIASEDNSLRIYPRMTTGDKHIKRRRQSYGRI